jgi:AcrR family transcriptional regulator
MDAARRLFLERGYTRTSVSAIATMAGVAPETVYADFGTKRGVLATILEGGLVGPDMPVALVDWPELTSVRAEPNAVRKIQLLAKLYRAIYERSAAVVDVMRAAANAEPEIAELLDLNQRQRLAGQANMMAHFADAGVLRAGLTVEEATDLCWMIASPEAYRLLVHDRRWHSDRYERWIAKTLCLLLLDESSPSLEAKLEVGARGVGWRSKHRRDDDDTVAKFLEQAVTTWARMHARS